MSYESGPLEHQEGCRVLHDGYGVCRCKAAPSALTREQVELDIAKAQSGDPGFISAGDRILAHDAALRATIEQQAQEIDTKNIEILGLKHEIWDLIGTRNTLQATLAERERDIAKLKAELNETFVDEKETVWTRPTAWAYAMVCKARDKHEQEAGRLRNNVELMARDMCSMPSDLYQEWLDSDSQVHFRQWLAERALKGEGCQGDTPPG